MTMNQAVREIHTFQEAVTRLKEKLQGLNQLDTPYWNSIVSILIVRVQGNETVRGRQIQITASRNPTPGESPTEDFFPSFVFNATFPSLRLAITIRMHMQNILSLNPNYNYIQDRSPWLVKKMEVRRRLANAHKPNPQPNIQIGYGNDLDEILHSISTNDYLIFIKKKNDKTYDVFGLHETDGFGTEKKLLVREPGSTGEQTVFSFDDLRIEEKRAFVRVFQNIVGNSFEFIPEENEIFEPLDEIFAYSLEKEQFTHLLEVTTADSTIKGYAKPFNNSLDLNEIVNLIDDNQIKGALISYVNQARTQISGEGSLADGN